MGKSQNISTGDILEEIFQDVKEKKRSMGRTIKFNLDKDKELLLNMKKALRLQGYRPQAVDKEDYSEGKYTYREMTMSEEVFKNIMSELDQQSKVISTDERQTIYDRAVRHVHFDGLTKKVIKEIENEDRLQIGDGQ